MTSGRDKSRYPDVPFTHVSYPPKPRPVKKEVPLRGRGPFLPGDFGTPRIPDSERVSLDLTKPYVPFESLPRVSYPPKPRHLKKKVPLPLKGQGPMLPNPGRSGPGTWHSRWAERLTQEISKHPSLVDPKIFAQSEAYRKHLVALERETGVKRGGAAILEERGYKLFGYGKKILTEALGGHPESFSPETAELGPEFISKWNKIVVRERLAKSVLRGPHEPVPLGHFYSTIAERARSAGVERELLSRLGSEAPEGLRNLLGESRGGQALPKIIGALRGLPGGWKITAGVAAGLLGLYVTQPLSLFSGKDDAYNTIEGLPHGGMAERSRRAHTDFGSGYRRLPEELMGQRIDPRILKMRQDVIDVPDARKALEADLEEREKKAMALLGELEPDDFFEKDLTAVEGIEARNEALRSVRLDQFNIDVEDADTLVLKRKGATESFALPVQIRLAGIDAPEVTAHKDDPLAPVRIFQEQPGGQEATETLRSILRERNNLQLLVSTEKRTYGRYLGALIGDGANVNVELVRQGAVTALPFGEAEDDIIQRTVVSEAEKEAIQQQNGLWRHARYQAIKEANRSIESVITHNTFTRLDKLASNLNLGVFVSFLEGLGGEERDLTPEEKQQARRMGRVLRKTHGSNRFSGKDDAYNTIEGLPHGGMAERSRRAHTDFGSGYIGKLFRGTREAVRKHVAQRTLDVIEKAGGHVLKVEQIFETVRKAHYPDRPSRFTSTFWTPYVESAAKWVDDAAGAGATVSETKVQGRGFLTNQEYFTEAMSRPSDAESWAHLYWKGLKPGDVKGPYRSGFPEVLIEGPVEATRQWKVVSKVNDWGGMPKMRFSEFNDAYNKIEGLPHGGMAEKSRHAHTDFGSRSIPRKLLSRVAEIFGFTGQSSPIVDLAKRLTFSGRAEFAYRKLITSAIRERGMTTRGLTWDVMTEKSGEGLALHIMAKRQGNLVAGMSRLFDKHSVDLTQIQVSEGLNLGKLLYRGEADVLKKLGYKTGTVITSPVSSPITARWQAQLYESTPTRQTGIDFIERLLRKDIGAEEFATRYAGTFRGALRFDGFVETGIGPMLRKFFGFGSPKMLAYITNLANKIFRGGGKKNQVRGQF
jgi:endonuclease YncB( thermonuclease family)